MEIRIFYKEKMRQEKAYAKASVHLPNTDKQKKSIRIYSVCYQAKPLLFEQNAQSFHGNVRHDVISDAITILFHFILFILPDHLKILCNINFLLKFNHVSYLKFMKPFKMEKKKPLKEFLACYYF